MEKQKLKAGDIARVNDHAEDKCSVGCEVTIVEVGFDICKVRHNNGEHQLFAEYKLDLLQSKEARQKYELEQINKALILKRATKENGCLEQCFMMQEEAAELIQAINKFRRLGGINTGIIAQPTAVSSQKYALAYNALCGEVADVEIMIAQMRSMLNADQIDLIKERKIARLEERLNAKGAKGE